MSKKFKLAIAAILCGLATVNASELKVAFKSHIIRPLGDEREAMEVSGITYAGGNLYYAIDDADKKLYPLTIVLEGDGSLLHQTNITIGAGVVMSGGSDMEGCAYDPCSGNVWVSDETGAYIREYDPATGSIVRTAPVPEIQKKYSANYSLEALTISGDGLTMWTSNEEALTVDGDLSSESAGSVVRLTRFTRGSVRDNWTPNGEWAYVTDAIGKEKDEYRRSGVSGLCALPDGSLLALERLCNRLDFTVKIYKVDFSGATDVSSLSSLKDASYTATRKTQLWKYNELLLNLEGICLGPRLEDGSCALVLVGDGGSVAMESVITLALSGLNVRTMNFEAPESGIGTPSIVGNNYRFIDGARLDVALLGDGCDPRGYTNRSDAVVNATYSLPAHDKNAIAGTVASFTVAADDTLSWTTFSAGAAGGDIFLNDTFEGYAVGAAGSKVAGWTGNGVVVESGYTPPAAGYVMQNAAHTKVLDADCEARRSVAADASAGAASRKVDVMVEVRRPKEPLADLDDPVQIALAVDTNGQLCVWHARNEGGVISDGWTPLSGEKFADGQWVRVGIEVEYSGTSGFVRIRLNGSICTTACGYREPDGKVAGGAWHRIACSASSLSEVCFWGTKVDDLIVTTEGYASEDASVALSTDGVPNAWFDENGLPRDATAKTGIPGYTMADVYATGVNPYGTDPFKIMSFSVDSAPVIEFNALASGYRSFKILRSSTPDFKPGTVTVLGAGDGTFTGNSSDWSTHWEGKATMSGSAFYKVVVE